MDPASSLLDGILADNSQHVIRLPTGAGQMLTFFEYLRQRAFESVVAGAQEALDLLESQKNRTQSQEHESNLAAPCLTAQAGTAAKPSENERSQGNLSREDDELLPAPRRRWRPDARPKERG
jgi:hypothetical protein